MELDICRLAGNLHQATWKLASRSVLITYHQAGASDMNASCRQLDDCKAKKYKSFLAYPEAISHECSCYQNILHFFTQWPKSYTCCSDIAVPVWIYFPWDRSVMASQRLAYRQTTCLKHWYSNPAQTPHEATTCSQNCKDHSSLKCSDLRYEWESTKETIIWSLIFVL